LAQQIGVLVGQHLADQLAHTHPAHVGHQGGPSRWNRSTDDSEPAVTDLPAILTDQ
jgi:hypothetical protein